MYVFILFLNEIPFEKRKSFLIFNNLFSGNGYADFLKNGKKRWLRLWKVCKQLLVQKQKW